MASPPVEQIPGVRDANKLRRHGIHRFVENGKMPNQSATRHATLKMSQGSNGPVLTAHVPQEMTREDFLLVAGSAYDTVFRMTHCNCMSGRISFVVEDLFADIARVEFPTP
jgi:hypothetical protein